jgi:hypothetical protein
MGPAASRTPRNWCFPSRSLAAASSSRGARMRICGDASSSDNGSRLVRGRASGASGHVSSRTAPPNPLTENLHSGRRAHFLSAKHKPLPKCGTFVARIRARTENRLIFAPVAEPKRAGPASRALFALAPRLARHGASTGFGLRPGLWLQGQSSHYTPMNAGLTLRIMDCGDG